MLAGHHLITVWRCWETGTRRSSKNLFVEARIKNSPTKKIMENFDALKYSPFKYLHLRDTQHIPIHPLITLRVVHPSQIYKNSWQDHLFHYPLLSLIICALIYPLLVTGPELRLIQSGPRPPLPFWLPSSLLTTGVVIALITILPPPPHLKTQSIVILITMSCGSDHQFNSRLIRTSDTFPCIIVCGPHCGPKALWIINLGFPHSTIWHSL